MNFFLAVTRDDGLALALSEEKASHKNRFEYLSFEREEVHRNNFNYGVKAQSGTPKREEKSKRPQNY